MEHKIDATGKSVGRLATEVATILLGKNNPATVAKNVVQKATVRVVNMGKVKIDAKKASEKTYHRHTGYPGGDRHPTMKHVIEKKGTGEVLRIAVHGMLPKNTLRERRMKQLVIED